MSTPSDHEEHALRIAKIHRRASLIYMKMIANVAITDQGKNSELLQAISNSFVTYLGPDLNMLAQQNPPDLVFRILACGMGFQKMLDEERNSKISALRRELNALPDGFTGLTKAVNEMLEEHGDQIMAELIEIPSVKKEYQKLAREMGA